MSAKIYRPAKTAMQSGKAKTHLWVLEFDQEIRPHDRSDHGLHLVIRHAPAGEAEFETQELAEAYAQRNGIEYRVIAPKDPQRQTVAYPDNFRYTRTQPWTH
jgi:hypothetical protein